MADFAVALTAGVTLDPWDDPQSVSPDRPSRINPRPEHIHKRHVGTTGFQVEVTATVGGVSGELDSNLGGELFSASLTIGGKIRSVIGNVTSMIDTLTALDDPNTWFGYDLLTSVYRSLTELAEERARLF